jgi:hypothetical protein
MDLYSGLGLGWGASAVDWVPDLTRLISGII